MNSSVEKLREIIARLRAPDGCPWDREQTPVSLSPSILEEAYEVVDAIKRGHLGDLEEELGDLLINIMMQTQIAEESHSFTFDSIAAVAAEKLIRRHPHVFAESSASSSEAVLLQWEEIKRVESLSKEGNAAAKISLLDGVARAFPALLRAQKIQKKAAKAGFDWEEPSDVVEKIREEIIEVEEEIQKMTARVTTEGSSSKERLIEELGDLLFAVVNLSRALSIDAESALQTATEKFSCRFRAMERGVPENKNFTQLSFEEMNALWDQVKQTEKLAHRS